MTAYTANASFTADDSRSVRYMTGYLMHLLANKRGLGRGFSVRIFGRSILLAVVRD